MSRRLEPAPVRTEAKRPLARTSPENEGSTGRDPEKRLARLRVWALALLVCVVACASPATTTRDTPVTGEEPPPRFAAGGADAEEFGASTGYPKGDRATFWDIGSVVGSHSHLDEIFLPGAIQQPFPGTALRAAAEPGRWDMNGRKV